MCDPNTDLSLEVEVALSLCNVVGSKVSDRVRVLIEESRWLDLLELQVDPADYAPEAVHSFADDYLVVKFLQKSPNLPTNIDCSKVAEDAFRASEDACKLTNERLLGVDRPGWLFDAYHIVEDVLGELDGKKLERILQGCGHGPGASVGVGGQIVPSDKYDRAVTLTKELIPFYSALTGPNWDRLCLLVGGCKVVKGGRFFTVRKNAKTDRGCSTEPTLNQFLQKGIGKEIAMLLRQTGVDIRNQEINQVFASLAHTSGLATIDLSQASDLISIVAALLLLPIRWFHLMDIARSKFCEIGGEEVELSKFCTMGNGFTFPLETLMFLAVARSRVPRAEWDSISVYGDDMIVPQQYAPAVVEALEFLGFKVNIKKSYLAGNFFESCGTDWFGGQNVRPFFAHRASDTDHPVPYSVQLANALRLYAKRRGVVGCDERFRPLWDDLVMRSPEVWRDCRVPVALGDTGIIDCQKNAISRPVLSKWTDGLLYDAGYEGRYYKLMVPKPVKVEKKTMGVLLVALMDISAPVPEYCDEADYGEWWESLTTLPTSTKKGQETLRGAFEPTERARWTVLNDWSDGLHWI